MRYTYFGQVLKKEGYEQISAIFTETADQEKEHAAKRMFKFPGRRYGRNYCQLSGSGVIGNTLENLRAAAAGEHEEWSLDYPHFADVAEQEGFRRLPLCTAISQSPRKATKKDTWLSWTTSKNMTVFAKEGEVARQCRNCGYIEIGKEVWFACLTFASAGLFRGEERKLRMDR